ADGDDRGVDDSVDCVFQSGESAAGAGCRPATRDRRPAIAGGEPRAPGCAIANREHAAGARRRGARPAIFTLAGKGTARDDERAGDGGRSAGRTAGGAVRAGTLARDGDLIRTRSGAYGDADQPGAGASRDGLAGGSELEIAEDLVG